MKHTIELIGYQAKFQPGKNVPLHLGTRDSYGIEQLEILPGEGWEGLTITVTFHPPGSNRPVRLLMGDEKLVNVPPEATASSSTLYPGRIVFAGLAEGVQRISCDLPYTVADHSPVEGPESQATPSMLEQAVLATAASEAAAEKSAQEAAASAEKAAASALMAVDSAAEAGLNATAAEKASGSATQSAAKAAESEAAAKASADRAAASEPAEAAERAEKAAGQAQASASQAQTARTGAETSANQADTAAQKAEAAAQAAETSRTGAAGSASAAAQSASAAGAAQKAAEAAKATVTESKEAAAQSASEATASASAAAASQTKAESAASQAKTAQNAAESAKAAAAQSASSAQTQAQAAQTAKTSAEASAAAAAASAQQAVEAVASLDPEAVKAALTPPGTVFYFAMAAPPEGWLACNGAAVSRSAYAALFGAIGTTYGGGDGSTTFTLPDLRDRVAWGGTSVGTVKTAGLPNITGTLPAVDQSTNYATGAFAVAGYANNTSVGSGSSGRQYSFDASKSNAIYGKSSTVQPPALTLLPCIKY